MRLNRARPRILIVGLGNVLLMDDGVGVHVARQIQKSSPPGILAVEVGTAVLDGLHLFEWADKILAVDAMEAGGPPGAMYLSHIQDIEQPGSQASLHEIGLASAFRFLLDSVKPETFVLGIEPEKIDYGLDLSPVLQAMMPQYIEVARSIAADWKMNIDPQMTLKTPEVLL